MYFSVVVFVSLCFGFSYAVSASKEGLCAPPNRLFITGTMQKCTADEDCPDNTKCCDSKGGLRVCAPAQPALSACQHQRTIAEEVGRSIDSGVNFTPECLENNGSYAPVQCSENKQRCWCVDEAGFEIPGTRAPLGMPINCSAPRVCPNPECRMLCPQSFRIMKDGCPVCECYDACEDIKCPRSTKCVTEELTCVNEPCPPISRCSARSIDDVDCPTGLPALVDTNKKDYYLCSLLDTIKASKCPGGFDCNVRPGKEYGVCCPRAPENVIKPGQCPSLNTTDYNSCVVECQVDQDCYGDAKCCSDNCTARCLTPVSAVTPTACQALKTAMANVPGVFSPACDAVSGHYLDIQCSGQKCWCVDRLTGLEKSGTRTVNGSLPNCAAPKVCAPLPCDMACEKGLQLDPEGCPICACHDPCSELSCPNGCNLLNIDCGSSNCQSVATCKEARSLDHPCIYGQPVIDNHTREYALCSGDAGSQLAVCPAMTHCEPMDAEGHGVCCPLPGTARTKLLNADRPDQDSLTVTKKSIMKTACQASAEYWLNSKLAVNTTVVPKCDANGNFEPVQCLSNICWCVDHNGLEIAGTRKTKGQQMECNSPKDCGPQCRIFCPFEFIRDSDGCFQCECDKSPCEATTCPSSTECKLMTLECSAQPCSIVPQCVPKPVVPAALCPFGSPLLDSFSNQTIPCGTAMDFEGVGCPVTHSCAESGICCPRQSVDICSLPAETGPCRAAMRRWHYNKVTSQCEQFIWGGCEGNINNFLSKELCETMCHGVPSRKNGHCPFPSSDMADNCRTECTSDGDCPGTAMCCSTGCGQVCMTETFQTACDIQNAASARMLAYPENSLLAAAYVPECQSDGSFNQRQCSDPMRRNMTSKECWCVREDGREIDGSRRLASAPQVDCFTIGNDLCKETMMCRMDCPFGFQHDPADGCPICECEDLCGAYKCPSGKECKILDMKTAKNEATRVPICASRPTPAPTCRFGEPISVPGEDKIRICSAEIPCPGTHTCSVPEGARIGVCCSKSPSVCLLSAEVGPCRGTIPRFTFDPTTQTCKSFLYGGCQGNGNNFASAEECNQLCGGTSAVAPIKPITKTAITDVCSAGRVTPPTALNEMTNGQIEACNQRFGCPLTHTCIVSGDDVSCCPKTSDDCFLPVVSGQCQAAITRVRFNPKTKSCEDFVYTGCGGNGNNFATPAQCRSLCPVMSQCEIQRRWALQMATNSIRSVFKPECDEFSGAWLPVQCHAETGMCWCVDENGRADMATAVRGYPRCDQEVTASSTAMAEVCPDGESMQFCDSQLCFDRVCYGHPRAQCRINPCGGCTAEYYDSENRKVDCNEGLSECQITFQSTVHSETWSKLKMPKPLFAPGTKSSGNGAEIVQIIQRPENSSAKLGMCPPYFALIHEGCAVECHSDAQCSEDKKCCFAGCGYTCVAPIPIATSKAGRCPAETSKVSPSKTCQHECLEDSDCEGSKLCCGSGDCDRTCREPRVDPAVMPLPYLPTCTISGHYDWTQCAGEICWCVTPNGTVRTETMTRGQIQCNATGVVIGTVHPVCSNGVQPEMCTNACMDSRCPGHPNFVCVADPCDHCKERLVDQTTFEPVRCEDVCHQTQPETKCPMGEEVSEKFYFNAVTQECRLFNSSKCSTHENRFDSSDECLDKCLSKDICMQEISTGPCRALMERWAYNAKTQQCEQFDYGGCMGNGNNFETKVACERRCPEILVCPKLSVTAAMSTCNRSGLCDHAKCAHPLAECHVEPCSCRAEFVDQWGRVMNCSELPTKCQQESWERSVMADVYHPQCTAVGKYEPLQCFADHFSEKCWCVDETGHSLDDRKFTRGSQNCGIVEILSTRIYMQFSTVSEMTDDLVKDTLTEILNQVWHENAVESLEILPAKHHVAAVVRLHGSRAADIAYFFERKVNITKLPAVLNLIQLRIDHEHPVLNEIVDARNQPPAVVLDTESRQDLLPLLAILGIVVIVIILLVFFLYRRRKMGSYTNRDDLSSHTDVEKLPPSNGPVKVIPNDYSTISEYKKPVEHIYEVPADKEKM